MKKGHKGIEPDQNKCHGSYINCNCAFQGFNSCGRRSHLLILFPNRKEKSVVNRHSIEEMKTRASSVSIGRRFHHTLAASCAANIAYGIQLYYQA